jgi:group I intron endonuclease
MYIGQAENIKTRARKHIESLIRGKHRNNKLQNSFNVYGRSAFDILVISVCPIDELDKQEQEWLHLFLMEYPKEDIYNLCFEPSTTRGYKFTEQQRKEQSERLKNKVVSEQGWKAYSELNKRRWEQGLMTPKPKKEFDIITPEGELVHVIGLSDFAKENNLSAGSLHQMLTGKIKQYRGYRTPNNAE